MLHSCLILNSVIHSNHSTSSSIKCARNLIPADFKDLPVQSGLKNNNTESLLSNIIQLNPPESTTNKNFSNFTSYINSITKEKINFRPRVRQTQTCCR